MSQVNFTIQAATLEDVPVMAKMWADAFKLDRNTQVKALGGDGYDLEEIGNSSLKNWIASPRCRLIKAVNDSTGETMGWCCWGFRGFNEDEVPALPNPNNVELQRINLKDVNEVRWKDEKAADSAKEEQPGSTAGEEISESEPEEPAKRLAKLTSDDMTRMMEKLMPEGTKCMFIVSLTVSPVWQSRGVGSALLRWGTENADKAGVFCWVHSSDSAWRTYARGGFEVIAKLDIDLDEYATSPPPSKELEGSEGKWGHYVFKWMKRLPLATATETQ
ncbi:hypothetical protein M422DRAFT_25504 [Sphaerobolus stellatus SS14]|nr:hypothetical protein M422DRAFT_25504 [Sphaerobolus stellatus SS14]